MPGVQRVEDHSKGIPVKYHDQNCFLRAELKRTSQLIFTCLKTTIETLEKIVKHAQSYQQKHQNDVVLFFLLFTLNIFHTFF